MRNPKESETESIHELNVNCHYCRGPSWSWSYGSWIYNYLCNLCPSPLKVRVRIPFIAICTRYNIMWYNMSVTCDRSVVFSRSLRGIIHQINWPPRCSWNIVENGVKHQCQPPNII